MKIKFIPSGILLLIIFAVHSQDLSYSKPGQQFFKELQNPYKPNMVEWSKVKNNVNVSFADDNKRYAKEIVPLNQISDTWNVKAWKGEKIHTQILVWGKVDVPEISFESLDLVNKEGFKINRKFIKGGFVRYTMSDTFEGGCSHGLPNVYDSSLVADPIDIINRIRLEANSVRPIWLSIEVPSNLPAGRYSGDFVVKADKEYRLKINLELSGRILPPPSEWSYDFDIWQYPAPIARIHDVALWSDQHFDLMRPYFTTLAKAGQKVISANIIEQPWGLDHVHFDDPTLIKWTKRKNSSWDYDFSLFDRYITFVKSCGITQRINCYSMITWDLSFIYFDEASGKNTSITLEPGTRAYRDFWFPMLTSFTRHLKDMGWFDITAIAMDERPIESMIAVIELLKEIDPEWKIALAGDTYHPEIEEDIYDYCLASYLSFGEDILEKRKAQGKPTTYYTACVEEYPNGYSFSPPAENAWLGWYAAAKGYTGYLFWAFNTWVANPLQDARWRRYPSGTLFQFYPGPRTSIRFEKLIEGIQDFEKLRILREEFKRNNDKDNLSALNGMLKTFELGKLDSIPAAKMVNRGKAFVFKF
ncbi:MAG: DUF4091 domain-containing protein [Bacteroidota bacterium]